MAIFGYENIRFDPVGFFQELGSRLGAMPSEGLRPPQIRIPPSSPDNVTATVQPPQSPDFPTLSVQQPLGNGLTGLDPAIQPEDFTHPELQKKHKELSQAAADQADEAKQNAIVPPALLEQAKAAKIKDPDMGMMLELIPKGINPLTDPKKFLEYFGATAAQNNMARTWGPLQSLREAMSPEYQSLQARQGGLLQVGTFLTKKILEQSAERLGAPRTLGEANAVAPGMVRPTAEQAQQRIEAPASDSAFVGPGQGVQDPNAKLMPWQQDLILGTMKGLAGGHLIRTPEGSIEPTQIAAIQGRRLTPEELAYMDRAATTDPNQAIPPTALRLPVSAGDKILAERGLAARAANLANRPNLNNKLEELTILESTRKYGKPMTYSELSKADPELAKAIFQRAEIDIPKEITTFEENERMRRQIAAAEPVKAATLAAERKAPVGPEISKYGRITMDGRNIDRPTDGKLSQEDLSSQGYVDLSKNKQEVDAVNDLNVIEKDLKKLKSYADELNTAGPGLGQMLAQGGRISLSRLSNSGKLTNITENGRRLTLGQVANLYTRQVNSMLEYYARNLRGIRGAGTEGDVNRMANNFAGAFTDKDTKDRLFGDTFNFVNDVRDGTLATMFGAAAVQKQKELRAMVRQMLLDGKSDEEIQKAVKGGK